MTTPAKINYRIYQGSTFSETFRWESATKIYKSITNVTKAAPVVLSVPAHGIKNGWRFRVTNVNGMKEINTVNTESYYFASNTTSDTITINDINSLGFTTYTNGGVIEYNQPVDLAGFTARMQIREKITSTDIIDSLTTENGRIVIDTVNSYITINIPANITQTYNFPSAVYSLELVRSQEVIPFLIGTLTLNREVTR
jgi:hypothetical protein